MRVEHYPYTLTRPNDSTVYSGGDVIGFIDADKAGKWGTSQAIRLRFLDIVQTVESICVVLDSVQARSIELELWVFRQAIEIQVDNAPFAPTEKDLMGLLAVIPLKEFQVQGKKVLRSDMTGIPVPFMREMWGVLVVRGAYTPKPGGQAIISLTAGMVGV